MKFVLKANIEIALRAVSHVFLCATAVQMKHLVIHASIMQHLIPKKINVNAMTIFSTGSRQIPATWHKLASMISYSLDILGRRKMFLCFLWENHKIYKIMLLMQRVVVLLIVAFSFKRLVSLKNLTELPEIWHSSPKMKS